MEIVQNFVNIKFLSSFASSETPSEISYPEIQNIDEFTFLENERYEVCKIIIQSHEEAVRELEILL